MFVCVRDQHRAACRSKLIHVLFIMESLAFGAGCRREAVNHLDTHGCVEGGTDARACSEKSSA